MHHPLNNVPFVEQLREGLIRFLTDQLNNQIGDQIHRPLYVTLYTQLKNPLRQKLSLRGQLRTRNLKPNQEDVPRNL